MTGSATALTSMLRLFSDKGATRFYIKFLSPNDNSKNQIYLGPDFSALNILPHQSVTLDSDISESKRERFKAQLRMIWITPDGNAEEVPAAQLILYPKYPEVRLSGFLRGTKLAPASIMRARDKGRILLFGIAENGTIFCHATGHSSPLARELESKKASLEKVGVFHRLLTEHTRSSRNILLAELRRIHCKGWIDSKRLDATKTILPCNSPHCGGYTLEAELGVTPNGRAEPDFLGWEIKQHSVPRWDAFSVGSPLTLMTPEPSEGYYKEHGVEAFVRKFGYPDRNGVPDRLNFGGVYRAGQRVESTGLTLHLDGFDSSTRKVTDIAGGLCLHTDTGLLAAKWKFTDLMRHWERKHSQAAYVPSMMRQDPARQYCYGPVVKLGEGADFLTLLYAISIGKVYYDPAVKLENASAAKPHSKRRSQFRIHPSQIEHLYRKMQDEMIA